MPSVSTPRFVHLPPGVDRRMLSTARGEHATLQAEPQAGAGNRRGTVLLVPGWTGSKEDFIGVLGPLSERGYHVVAIDQRGQYESPGVDDPAAYTVAALGADLVAVAQTLSTPVHLVGHSFGGLVVRAAVRADPAAFASLVLLSTGPAAVASAQRQLLNVMVDTIQEHGLAVTWEGVQAYNAAANQAIEDPHLTPEVAAFLERRFLANHPISLATISHNLVSAPDDIDATRAVLQARRLPTLVCFGSDDDGWSPAEQREMAGRLDAQLAEIPGSGHSPAVDSPEALATTLHTFFAAPDPAGNDGP